MSREIEPRANIQQAVPFFRVDDIERSVRFYVDGLGGEVLHHWSVDGKLRWCWIKLGDAALMLQEHSLTDSDGQHAACQRGAGVSISFQCRDALALYRAFCGRGLMPRRPFVGNGMWVTSLTDPDGYQLEFESFTDVAENTEYTDEVHD